MIIEELLANLYDSQSPYDSVDRSYVDDGYPHTNIVPELLRSLFFESEPRFILECGSMLGGSAVIMASLIKELNLNANVVCIDPFTGSVDMWFYEQPGSPKQCKEVRPGWKFLGLENGVPTIYKRFLANVYDSGHSDVILPINCTTIVGVRLLEKLFRQGRISSLPDFIYLDSAHEPDETLSELRVCWSILNDGVLFGDDWNWASVRNDVIDFASECEINGDRMNKMKSLLPGSEIVDGKILLSDGQWVLFKNQ